MFISLNWIKDFVNLDGIDVLDLIKNRFTLAVAEIEGVEEKGKNLSGVVTAKILSVENHPNSKKLHILKVDKGDEIVDIVCGAPNVREGMIVPLATLGANVNGITISSATLGGVVSNGMCCSAKEIGDIRRVFRSMYSSVNIGEFLSGDRENLEFLKEEVQKLKNDYDGFDKIQKKQIEWFIGNLEEIIQKLS